MVKTKIINIQKLLKNDYEIIEEKTSALTAPGEHYGSVMLAVDLKIKSTERDEDILHTVAKLPPSNPMLREVFDVQVTFKKEISAYTEAIPAVVQFQREYGIPEEKLYVNIFPQCYGARINIDDASEEIDDTSVLLFDNLKFHGYYTEDRLRGFDAEAVKIILKNMARFHATPIAFKLLKPQVFEQKVRTCLVSNSGLERVPEIAEVFHSSIVEGAKDCPDLCPYLDKIQKICNQALKHSNSVTAPPNEPWGTLSHNDFWTSNTMILKKDNKYIDNKIVDLQLITYDSPVKDLIFFLYSSVINSVLDQYLDEFISIYHKHFIETLKDFGQITLEQFSWEEFQKEIQQFGKEEMYHILFMLKPICTERGVVKNSAENFQNSDWTRKDLLGPNHRRKLRDTVLAFAKRGWI